MVILATYVVLQLLYNFALKQVAVADVFLISLDPDDAFWSPYQ